MFKNKFVVAILAVLPFVLIVLITVFLFGIRRYGMPGAYREQQAALVQAREDSLRALEALESPENIADSTLFGMNAPSRIVEETQAREAEIRRVQVLLDSLDLVRNELDAREASIAIREENLTRNVAQTQEENAQKLAGFYNSMRTNMAVPLFVSMDDTLAVRILTYMEERSAAQLLGALAEADVNKATRLNKLLSTEGGVP